MTGHPAGSQGEENREERVEKVKETVPSEERRTEGVEGTPCSRHGEG